MLYEACWKMFERLQHLTGNTGSLKAFELAMLTAIIRAHRWHSLEGSYGVLAQDSYDPGLTFSWVWSLDEWLTSYHGRWPVAKPVEFTKVRPNHMTFGTTLGCCDNWKLAQDLLQRHVA